MWLNGHALGEAITALRRGEPVLIPDYQGGALAVAGELVTKENLRRLRKIVQRPAGMLITRHPAVLGATPASELSGAIAIPVSFQFPAAVIRSLADPSESVGSGPPTAALFAILSSLSRNWDASLLMGIDGHMTVAMVGLRGQ